MGATVVPCYHHSIPFPGGMPLGRSPVTTLLGRPYLHASSPSSPSPMSLVVEEARVQFMHEIGRLLGQHGPSLVRGDRGSGGSTSSNTLENMITLPQ